MVGSRARFKLRTGVQGTSEILAAILSVTTSSAEIAKDTLQRHDIGTITDKITGSRKTVMADTVYFCLLEDFR